MAQSIQPNANQPAGNKMMTYTISPLGSADKGNQDFLSRWGKVETTIGAVPNMSVDYNTAIQLSPLMENFGNTTGPLFKDYLKNNPQLQVSMFDIDNAVKSNAGIFRKQEDGLGEFGLDEDGNKLWASPETTNDNILNAGQVQLSSMGTLFNSLGAFRNQDEANQFVSFQNAVSNPRFHGNLTAQIAAGDKRSATDLILKTFGQPSLDDLEKDPTNSKAVGVAFAANNLVNNWDKMNDTQRSMSLSGLGMSSYTFGDEEVSNRILIDSKTPGGPKLTVGNAMALASSGIDVLNLQKNWDQFDMITRLTNGGQPGTSSQMAAVAKQFGMLGDAGGGGAAVAGLTAEQLGAQGFQSAPSAGMGAIIGPSSKVPEGYTVVAGGSKEGQVIAVPQSLMRSSATINGTSKVVTLGGAQASTPAGIGTYKAYDRWTPTNGQKDAQKVGGTLVGAGLYQAAAQNPYLASAIATASVYGNTLNKGEQSSQPSFTEQLIKSKAGKEAVTTAGRYVGQQVAGGAPTVTERMPNGNVKMSDGSVIGSDGKYVTKGDYANKGTEYAGYALAIYNEYKILTNDNLNKEQKVAGTIGTAAQAYNIYSGGSSVTAGAIGAAANVAMTMFDDNMTNEQKATRAQQQIGLAVADAYTYGMASVAEGALRSNPATAKYLGKLDKLDQKYNPVTMGLAKVMGGKTEEQQARDTARATGQRAGIVSDDFKVTLYDGSTADVGVDGHGGQHEFRNPDLVPEGNEKRTLNAYDVDYTNDLDFTANMMTSALTRMLSGGKGTPTDQFAGQLANAAISQVGFGQDMTDDNFNKVQANVRGWFFQSGVKTKEDAYALMNQGVHEGRFTEADAIAMQQGINMAFDDNGLDTAHQLMAGRWNGVKTAEGLPNSPGPNMQFVPQGGQVQTKPFVFSPSQAGGEGLEASIDTSVRAPGSLVTYPGTYWGASKDDYLAAATRDYKDPWVQELADRGVIHAPKTNLMTMEELKQLNKSRNNGEL